MDPRITARFGVALGVVLGLGVAECRLPADPRLPLGAHIYGHVARADAGVRGEGYCALCHGDHGEGYVADGAPALSNQEYLSTVSDEFLKAAVEHGRSATTMSPWARSRGGPLSSDYADVVVAYMRSWQTVPTKKLDERPATGDPIRGAALYDAECASCHGKGGLVGAKYLRLAGPELLGTATNGFLRHAIRVGRPGTPMPGYAAELGEQGVEDVLTALRSWQTHPTADAGAPPPPVIGPVILNPQGGDPIGFTATLGTGGPFTPADVIKDQLDKGARMGFLDARPPPSYVDRHIAGAVNIPFYEPDNPLIGQLPKDTWLISYCGCPHAESGTLAATLQGRGFTKVTVIDEGYYTGWENRGWPTHVGPTP